MENPQNFRNVLEQSNENKFVRSFCSLEFWSGVFLDFAKYHFAEKEVSIEFVEIWKTHFDLALKLEIWSLP